MSMLRTGILLALATLAHAGGAVAQCAAESSPRRVALLELYTSEGCDSCPPTDRWVSALPRRGLGTEHVVTLAFHVDYWNYLGWNDPYAKPEHSARQRAAAHRNRARAIYTPQLLLNGGDYRPGRTGDDAKARISAINQGAPAARLRVSLSLPVAGTLAVAGSAAVPEPARRERARAYLALYENDLETDVRAGENRGKRLRHDFVVRSLAGPFPVPAGGEAVIAHRFPLDAGWKPRDLHVAFFVQDEHSGEVLQALALRNCS